MQSSCHSNWRLDKVLVLAGWVMRGLHHCLVVPLFELEAPSLVGTVVWNGLSSGSWGWLCP